MTEHSDIEAVLSFLVSPNCTQGDLLSDELPSSGTQKGLEQAV